MRTLARFLRSRLGRPWRAVEAELRRKAAAEPSFARSRGGYGGWDDGFGLVETRAVQRGGRWTYGGAWRHGEPMPPGELYVCPETGRLCETPPAPPAPEPTEHVLGPERRVRQFAGAWYELRMRPLPDDRAGCFDAWLGKPLSRVPEKELETTYHARAYAGSARRLTPREERRLPRLLRTGTRR